MSDKVDTSKVQSIENSCTLIIITQCRPCTSKSQCAPIIDASKSQCAPIIDASKSPCAPIIDASKSPCAPIIDADKNLNEPFSLQSFVKEYLNDRAKV